MSVVAKESWLVDVTAVKWADDLALRTVFYLAGKMVEKSDDGKVDKSVVWSEVERAEKSDDLRVALLVDRKVPQWAVGLAVEKDASLVDVLVASKVDK